MSTNYNSNDDFNDDLASDSVDAVASSNDESIDAGSIAAKEKLRNQLNDAVAKFLAEGGKVQQLDSNASATVMRSAADNYGDRPI